MRSLVVALVILAAAAAVPRAEPNVQPTRDQTLNRFFAPTTPPLVSYRAHRKLSAATRGGKMTASLEAVTSLDPGAGFSYQVLSEEGSSIILHHVLHPALDAEQKAVRTADSRQSALTLDNYDFLGISPASDSLVKVDIKPRRKHIGLRGLRTLAVRLARHAESALRIAGWLAQRAEVREILYPPLPSDRGHAIWARDFSGACGLFGVVLKPAPKAAIDAMINGLKRFGLGFSWGGYESLLVPSDIHRTAAPFAAEGPVIRIHAGLEDPQDLIDDLIAGFDRLRASS